MPIAGQGLHKVYVTPVAQDVRGAEVMLASIPKHEPKLSETKGHEQISINFLLNNPQNDDFIGRFPTCQNGTVETESNDGTIAPSQPISSVIPRWCDGVVNHDTFFGAGMSFDSFFDNLENLSFGAPLTHSDIPMYPPGEEEYSTIFSGLEPRVVEIKAHLRLAAAKLDEANGTSHLMDLAPMVDRIRCSEIETCVDLFFRYYHRHCPIIHKPSFSPVVAPLPLLLAVMALGGMYHKDPGKIVWIRKLLDPMEAYIYGLPGLGDEHEGGLDLSQAADDDTLHHQFETFQGAYFIIVAQYFSGSITARRRVRQQRFSRVLTIARSFNLPTAQHERVLSITNQHSFQRWVQHECYVRTMNVMLLLDSAFGIFDNIPPRVDICELDLQLPCDPIYFNFANYHEMAINSLFPHQKMKVLDAYQRLFMTSGSASGFLEPARQSPLNCWDLLVVVHLLYSFAWRQIFSNPLLGTSSTSVSASSTVLDPLKLAVQNWKAFWDEARAAIPSKELREMGFEISANSYWALTSLLVHCFETKSTGSTDGGTPESKRNLEVMPIESDCKNQGSHLRKVLQGWN